MAWLVALAILAVAAMIFNRRPHARALRVVKVAEKMAEKVVEKPLPPYDEEAAQRELTGSPPLICRALHRCGAVLVGLLLASLLGCVVNFDTASLHDIAPGVNRLDKSDMDLYREVWGDWLQEHRYRPRPDPQSLTVNGRGQPWLFVSTWQEQKR